MASTPPPPSPPRGDLALSFMFTAVAGAAASLGGAVVFLPAVRGAAAGSGGSGGGATATVNKTFVALAFSLSTGLMLFVSFTDTFATAMEEFRGAGYSKGTATLWTGLAFFVGVALVTALEAGVDRLMAAGGCAAVTAAGDRCCACCRCLQRCRRGRHGGTPASGGSNAAYARVPTGATAAATAAVVDSGGSVGADGDAANAAPPPPPPPPSAATASSDRTSLILAARRAAADGDDGDVELAFMPAAAAGDASPAAVAAVAAVAAGGSTSTSTSTPVAMAGDAPATPQRPATAVALPTPPPAAGDDAAATERAHMEAVGLVAVITLSLTNIPEGIAAFVSTMADTRTGAVVSLATALESALEGAVIALPMYYGTRKPWLAFAAAAASGVAAPIGSLVAWGALEASPSRAMFGYLFGMVSGSLVWVTLRELIPNALAQDPAGRVTPYGFLGGMALVLVSNSLSSVGGGA